MQVSDIDKKIEVLTKLKEILLTEPGNLCEKIFLKYIELNKTDLVARYLNDEGYRVKSHKGFRKYISTDITDILDSEEAKSYVRKEIYDLTINIKKSKRLLDRFLLEGDINAEEDM